MPYKNEHSSAYNFFLLVFVLWTFENRLLFTFSASSDLEASPFSSISSEGEPIQDVPVVYFVDFTRSNLSTIAQDYAKRLYSKVHLDFVPKSDWSLMEEFAKTIVQSNCLDVIASVHDQYLDFVCLEKNLFSLSNKAESYVAMNGGGITDQGMENYMEGVAYGLFSVMGTLGSVPVIRCPKVISKSTCI